MDHFEQLLKSCSNYRPVETWRIEILDTIPSMSGKKKRIQILFNISDPLNLHLHDLRKPLNGHWVCCYYDTKNIFIYDLLNNKKLHEHHKQFLRRLFPFYSFDKQPVKFPTVQQQLNISDCDVFAIAFAISLLFNIKPVKVEYDYSLMPSYLIKIFESNMIEHFPQD